MVLKSKKRRHTSGACGEKGGGVEAIGSAAVQRGRQGNDIVVRGRELETLRSCNGDEAKVQC